MLNRDAAIDRVTHFAKEIKLAGVKLKQVILFGSYAHNHQDQWSDIDVALVADEFTGFGFEDRKYFASINIKKEYIDIDTKTYPVAYFEKGDPFIDEIKKTGIAISI